MGNDPGKVDLSLEPRNKGKNLFGGERLFHRAACRLEAASLCTSHPESQPRLLLAGGGTCGGD